MPAASVTPVSSSVMTLVVSSMSAVGVKVAVQVMPPSPELTADSVPFSIVRSALVKPVTASLNLKVTSEVSPAMKRGVRHHDVGVRTQRVDRVIVGDGGADAGIARRIGHAGVVQRDDVGGVLDVRRRGEGRRPGDAAVNRGDRVTGCRFWIVRSALVKPVTASLKVKVTSEVSPARRLVSATTMVASGRSVSTGLHRLGRRGVRVAGQVGGNASCNIDREVALEARIRRDHQGVDGGAVRTGGERRGLGATRHNHVVNGEAVDWLAEGEGVEDAARRRCWPCQPRHR